MSPEARLRRIVKANRVRSERHARYLRGERSPRAMAALHSATAKLLAEVREGRSEAMALRLAARALPKGTDRAKALHRQADSLSLRSMARAAGLSVEALSQMLRADERRRAGLPPWRHAKDESERVVRQ